MPPRKISSITSDGVLRLFLRVTPGAAANRITGIWDGADGERRLALGVTAAPDKGKANKAVVAHLAKAFGLPKSSISITAGETSRFKTVLLDGDANEIASQLEKLTGASK